MNSLCYRPILIIRFVIPACEAEGMMIQILAVSVMLSVFRFECDILNHLLVAQTTMSDWMFLTALLHIHEAHTKLSSWGILIQPKEVSGYVTKGQGEWSVIV
jgi:hypothetical protein